VETTRAVEPSAQTASYVATTVSEAPERTEASTSRPWCTSSAAASTVGANILDGYMPKKDASISTQTAIRAAAFRSALRSFLRTSEEIAHENGLTPQRHLLLLLIKGAPDGSEQATVGELVERLELAQSTVTELVQRAEDVGLVERERSDEDARVDFLRLTREGERRLAHVSRAHADERHLLYRMLEELEQVDGQQGD
jgi:DNA-binding MarR family transcriptional regulator